MPEQQLPTPSRPASTPATTSPATTTDFGSNAVAQSQLGSGGGQGGSGTGGPPQQANVPRTEPEVLAAARARYGAKIAELESRPKKADERLKPYVDRFSTMQPNSWNAEAAALWKEFFAVYGEVSAQAGDTSGVETRDLYDHEFVALIDEWNAATEAAGEPLEARAQLAHMYRRTLRELSRTLMQDTNAVNVLRARDLIMHGSPDGPSFASLVDKNMGRGQSRDQALQTIVGSSTKHDATASEAARNSAARGQQPQGPPTGSSGNTGGGP